MINTIKIFFFFALLIFTSGYVKSQPGCPNINAGPDQTINCTTTSTNLTATVLATGATTSYLVSQIPYTPPYPYNTGTPILVNIDDTWSNVITIPFTFCFYGNNYTQLVAGSNGLITFDLSTAGGYCSWAFTSLCPSTILQNNAVFGPYHDIDPSVSGNMYYAILGAYPCRTFVVSWNQVAMYDCYEMLATHQIVLYESTNVIEVYIQNKPLCSTWNDGNAVVGIQNIDGTIGITAPGRNTSQWLASNEAWRFTPNGTPNYAITWLQGTTQIGTTPTITVSPTSTTTYTAQVVYNCCSGNQVTVTDDVVVNVSNSIGLTINPANPVICGGGSSTLTASSTNPAATFHWNTGSTTAAITVSPTSTTTYTVTASTPGCSSQASVDVTVSSNPVIPVNSSSICNGQSATLTASGATSYIWSTGGTDSSIIVSPANTTTYTVTGTISGCTGTGTGIVTVNTLPNAQISPADASCGNNNGSATATGGATYLWSNGLTSATITGLAPGNYSVTVTSAAGCSSSTSVIINNSPLPTATASSTNETCGLSNGTATASVVGTCSPSFSYQWSAIPVQTSQTATNLPAGTYTVTVTCNGCTTTASTMITNIAGPSVSISSITGATCSNANGSANALVNSGTPPYNYTWSCSPPQHTQNMVNVIAGNYIVTATDLNGCTATTSALISGTQSPTATTSAISEEICGQANGAADVTALGGLGTYTYIWNNGDTTSTVTGLTAGSYSVTVSDGSCTTSATVNVLGIPGPDADFSAHPNVLTIMDGPVSFADNSSGTIINWQWNFGDSTQNGSGEEINHDYENIGTYLVTLIVTDNNGCTDTVTDTIKVKDIFTFYIPNAFTPDGDDINDIFLPKGINIDLENYEMTIYNRWGNLIFRTTNLEEGWNGTYMNKGNVLNDIVVDTYIYLIKVKELEGPKHEYIGKITLVR